MAEVSSIDILIGATALGIAVWSQVIEQAPERIAKYDSKYWKVVSGGFYFGSYAILLGLMVAITLITIDLGGAAVSLYLVLLALVMAALPTAYITLRESLEPFEEMEQYRDAIIPVIILLGIVIAGWLAARYGINLAF